MKLDPDWKEKALPGKIITMVKRQMASRKLDIKDFYFVYCSTYDNGGETCGEISYAENKNDDSTFFVEFSMDGERIVCDIVEYESD